MKRIKQTILFSATIFALIFCTIIIHSCKKENISTENENNNLKTKLLKTKNNLRVGNEIEANGTYRNLYSFFNPYCVPRPCWDYYCHGTGGNCLFTVVVFYGQKVYFIDGENSKFKLFEESIEQNNPAAFFCIEENWQAFFPNIDANHLKMLQNNEVKLIKASRLNEINQNPESLYYVYLAFSNNITEENYNLETAVFALSLDINFVN